MRVKGVQDRHLIIDCKSPKMLIQCRWIYFTLPTPGESFGDFWPAHYDVLMLLYIVATWRIVYALNVLWQSMAQVSKVRLRPLIWPAELSLKKQTELGKLKILTPLYSNMHIAKIHVAVSKAWYAMTPLQCLKSKIFGDNMNPSIHRVTHNLLDSCAQRNFFLRSFGFRKSTMWPTAGKLWRPLVYGTCDSMRYENLNLLIHSNVIIFNVL